MESPVKNVLIESVACIQEKLQVGYRNDEKFCGLRKEGSHSVVSYFVHRSKIINKKQKK